MSAQFIEKAIKTIRTNKVIPNKSLISPLRKGNNKQLNNILNHSLMSDDDSLSSLSID